MEYDIIINFLHNNLALFEAWCVEVGASKEDASYIIDELIEMAGGPE